MAAIHAPIPSEVRVFQSPRDQVALAWCARVARAGCLSLDAPEVAQLRARSGKSARRQLQGLSVSVRPRKLQVFQRDGHRCVACGAPGLYYALERDLDNRQEAGYTLQLYALHSDGGEVVMTLDHVQPRSRGGSDEAQNLATMCRLCNQLKADT